MLKATWRKMKATRGWVPLALRWLAGVRITYFWRPLCNTTTFWHNPPPSGGATSECHHCPRSARPQCLRLICKLYHEAGATGLQLMIVRGMLYATMCSEGICLPCIQLQLWRAATDITEGLKRVPGWIISGTDSCMYPMQDNLSTSMMQLSFSMSTQLSISLLLHNVGKGHSKGVWYLQAHYMHSQGCCMHVSLD